MPVCLHMLADKGLKFCLLKTSERKNCPVWSMVIKMTKLYIVIPCYNEEAVLSETAARLGEKMHRLMSDHIISDSSKVILVDDGSTDKTWELITEIHYSNRIFSGCKLTRNQGHQNALLSGLDCAREKCDAVITMDADLQDDINVIDEFIKKYEEGNEIVYGVRSSRKKDSFFKNKTAKIFYKLMNFMGAEIIPNHADYRLLGSRALESLFEFKEVNLFLRGIVPLIGYKSAKVYYERKERYAGESKYPLKKMISFALDGITSFSIKPIKMITSLGVIFVAVSGTMLIYSLVSYFTGHSVSGWASLITSIWALGGLQLLAIGIIGEYIGKMFLETKKRPRYIIEEFLDEDK